jgi:hypothetical protein
MLPLQRSRLDLNALDSTRLSTRLDSFVPIAYEKTEISKRQILREIALVYDCMGLICPFTITARIILQHVWRLRTDWDTRIASLGDETSQYLLKRYDDWKHQLASVDRIIYQRVLFHSKPIETFLVGFCDAAVEAYACSVYIISRYPDKQKGDLVAASSKVSPLSGRTLQQLELLGAQILVRKMKRVMLVFPDAVRVVYYTDSVTVLSQISKPAKAFKPFVANRVA